MDYNHPSFIVFVEAVNQVYQEFENYWYLSPPDCLKTTFLVIFLSFKSIFSAIFTNLVSILTLEVWVFRQSPPLFWKSTCRHEVAAGKNQYGAKTDFSNTSGCEATAKLLKAVWAELLKMLFYPGRIYLSEGLYRCIFIFHETYGRSSLAQFQVAAKRAHAYGKSATGAGEC